MVGNPRQTISESKLLSDQGYRLIQKIGEGSYANVYLGEFSSRKGESLKVACKIISLNGKRKTPSSKFLHRELNILSAINHPYIVHVHSIMQRQTSYFIFMRYAEKGDLFEFIKMNGPIKESQARVWVRQIALALQYLHTLDIAHRDLKCENILVTNHLNLKITDFGFARYVRDENGQYELSETFCGSKQYVAPEILNGIRYDALAADMWSFGVILYTMLNKALPFREHNKAKLYAAQVRKDWKFRRRVIDTLTEEVKQLVHDLMEPVPAIRISISDVVNSNWIAMDPKLTKLTAAESKALYTALEIANSPGQLNLHRPSPAGRKTVSSLKRHSKDVVFWKHMQTGLEVDKSFAYKFDDIVLNS